MLYLFVADLLPTFESRLYEVICLGNDGAVVYIILILNYIIRTKPFKTIEEESPWFSLLNNVPDSDLKSNEGTESNKET